MRSSLIKNRSSSCVGQPEKKCRKSTDGNNVRCVKCWGEMATSDNGLIRLQAANDLKGIAGVDTESFARLANDPVTAVRLSVVENSPTLSAGWQMHMAEDKEVSIWRALAQRPDMSQPLAMQLLTKKDPLTLNFMIHNPVCPTAAITWIAANGPPELAKAAQEMN